MDLIFKRSPTSANTALVLEFPVVGTRFLVKNLTDNDIYVALKETDNKGDCLLIPADTAQVVQVLEGPYVFGTNVVTIIPEETSEKGVEVQCLKW